MATIRIEIESTAPGIESKVQTWIARMIAEGALDRDEYDPNGRCHDLFLTAWSDDELLYGVELDGQENNGRSDEDGSGNDESGTRPPEPGDTQVLA